MIFRYGTTLLGFVAYIIQLDFCFKVGMLGRFVSHLGKSRNLFALGTGGNKRQDLVSLLYSPLDYCL